MPRPVCLFTGQWADLPLETLAKKAKSFGYDGLELACWGDHFDPQRALREERHAVQLRLRAARIAEEAGGEAGGHPEARVALEHPQEEGHVRHPRERRRGNVGGEPRRREDAEDEARQQEERRWSHFSTPETPVGRP